MAPLVALVLDLGPVLDRPTAAVAAGPTPAELAVQGVEHLAVDLAEQQVAEHGTHVPIEVTDVGAPRRVVEVDNLEVSVEQLLDRRPRPRVPALVDLSQESR